MDNVLRALVDLRDRTLQKNRIAFSHRLTAIEQDRDQADQTTVELLQRWHSRFLDLEKECERDIAELLEGDFMAEQLMSLRGISDILASKLLAMIDPKKANTASALWKFAGYGLGEYWENDKGEIVAPKQGYQFLRAKGKGRKEKIFAIPEPEPGWKLVTVRDRSIKGWARCYNLRLKTACWLVARSFLMCNSPYRVIYDRALRMYEMRDPGWPVGRRHRAARRKMIKAFLVHLWIRWRTLSNLPVRNIYAIEYGGHNTFMPAVEFGWPLLPGHPEA